MAVEKLLMSKLLVPGSNRRLQTIDKSAGIAITGLVADGRQLVNRARSECSGWLDAYNYHMPPDVLCNHLSEYVHYFTLHGSLRPFGAACILASYDEVGARVQRCSPRSRPTHVFCARARPPTQELKTHQLHMIEPSGLSFVRACCINVPPGISLTTPSHDISANASRRDILVVPSAREGSRPKLRSRS